MKMYLKLLNVAHLVRAAWRKLTLPMFGDLICRFRGFWGSVAKVGAHGITDGMSRESLQWSGSYLSHRRICWFLMKVNCTSFIKGGSTSPNCLKNWSSCSWVLIITKTPHPECWGPDCWIKHNCQSRVGLILVWNLLLFFLLFGNAGFSNMRRTRGCSKPSNRQHVCTGWCMHQISNVACLMEVKHSKL